MRSLTPPSSRRRALPQSPPAEGAVGGAWKETKGMPLARSRRVRPGAGKLPQTVGLQRVEQQLRKFLTCRTTLWDTVCSSARSIVRSRPEREKEAGTCFAGWGKRATAHGRRSAPSPTWGGALRAASEGVQEGRRQKEENVLRGRGPPQERAGARGRRSAPSLYLGRGSRRCARPGHLGHCQKLSPQNPTEFSNRL